MDTVTDKIDSDKIEHDGADDLIDAVFLSEIGGTASREESCTQRNYHYNEDRQEERGVRQVY